MIRVVLLIEPTTEGDPLHEVESWDWYSLINGDPMYRCAPDFVGTEVEVESVEWVNR